MKQKVSLARVLFSLPDAMLFDEPSTGLDVLSSKLIHDFILKCKKDNKAIVFSSHKHVYLKQRNYVIELSLFIKVKVVASGTIEQLKKDYQKII